MTTRLKNKFLAFFLDLFDPQPIHYLYYFVNGDQLIVLKHRSTFLMSRHDVIFLGEL